VKAIVERHGGTVSAHNEGGAVFDILLPAAERKGPPVVADSDMSSEDDESDAA
jgi:hypothetical protein